MSNDFDIFDFFGEPISVYTDADAQGDGIISDISQFEASFNGLPINRITIGAANVLEIENGDAPAVQNNLRFVANHSRKDRDGADAWGIFEPTPALKNEKLWLVCNEVGGYTLMLPSEY